MALSLRTRSRLIRAATIGLLLAAVIVLWVGLSHSEVQEEIGTLSSAINVEPEVQAAVSPRVDPDDPSWKVRLRRPLYDPPPPEAPKVVKKEAPPIRAVLLGTIIEPGASRAMIKLPGGAVEFRGLGDPLGDQDPGAVVTEIGPQSIRVARDEDVTELLIERGY